MDTELITKLSNDIVLAEFINHWKFWGISTCLIIIALYYGSKITNYALEKGKNLATKEDFNSLKLRLAEQTQLTEGIKNQLSHGEWTKKENKTLRRNKLEMLVETLLEAPEWASLQNKNLIYDQEIEQFEKLNKIEMLCNLYFPEFKKEATQIILLVRDIYVSILECRHLNSGKTSQEYLNNVQARSKKFQAEYADLLSKITALNNNAALIMKEIIRPV